MRYRCSEATVIVSKRGTDQNGPGKFRRHFHSDELRQRILPPSLNYDKTNLPLFSFFLRVLCDYGMYPLSPLPPFFCHHNSGHRGMMYLACIQVKSWPMEEGTALDYSVSLL